MQRKAITRGSTAAWPGKGWEKSWGAPTPWEGQLDMLPMSQCCSCISNYVHCTEIIFPFNTRSPSSEQCNAQHCMSLGWGWFPAGAPNSFTCCSGQCCQGAVPRHCWSQARQPWAPAAGHSSNTPPVCTGCVPPHHSFASIVQMGKAKIKNTPPPSGRAANTSSCKPLCNGHYCANLTGLVGWVSACQASGWISRKPKHEAGTFNAGLWPDVIRCRAVHQDHECLATTLCCAEQEQKPLSRRSQDETWVRHPHPESRVAKWVTALCRQHPAPGHAGSTPCGSAQYRTGSCARWGLFSWLHYSGFQPAGPMVWGESWCQPLFTCISLRITSSGLHKALPTCLSSPLPAHPLVSSSSLVGTLSCTARPYRPGTTKANPQLGFSQVSPPWVVKTLLSIRTAPIDPTASSRWAPVGAASLQPVPQCLNITVGRREPLELPWQEEI